MKDVTLTGSKDSNVIVNELNNHITGNNGFNKILLSGDSSQYIISRNQEGKVVISDQIDSRDGVNTVSNIEQLVFTDKILSL